MTQLQVAAEGTALAPPAVVWALVSDPSRYPEWGPWSAGGYRQRGDGAAGCPGAVQWLRSSRRTYLRYPTSTEKILAADPERRLVYTVVSGIPVRNYRAEITLTPAAGGTHIRWAAAWDPTLAGRIVLRTLRTLYPEIVASLITAAEAHAAGHTR
jgi:uncharacterized protein YndB with AHSA1/START domain